jgi:hypothetical protein
MAGITNMVTDVKELFNKSLIVKGYQGTVNANDNGKVIIVTCRDTLEHTQVLNLINVIYVVKGLV